MANTFLGKSVPKGKKHSSSPVRKKKQAHWETLLLLPIVACGSLLALQHSALTSAVVGERSTGNALAQVIYTPTPTNHTLAAIPELLAAGGGTNNGTSGNTTSGNTTSGNTTSGNTSSSGSTTSSPDPNQVAATICNANNIYSAFFGSSNQLNSIFPIIPNGVRGLDASGKPSDKVCSPPYWGREVIYFFAYKALAILNWFAGTVAIILTLYAGLLYMLGTFNESNAKNAKNWLVGIYGGLIIVILAKALVYGSINVAVKNDPATVIKSAPPIPGLNPDGSTKNSGSTGGSSSSSGSNTSS